MFKSNVNRILAVVAVMAVVVTGVSYQIGFRSGLLRGGVPHVSMMAAKGGSYTYDSSEIGVWASRIPSDITWDSGPITILTSGYYHTCLGSGSYVSCWGFNDDGQAEVNIQDMGGVESIGAGADHTCTVVSDTQGAKDGFVHCWGSETAGQTDVPHDLGRVSEVAAGSHFTCALTVSGRVRCWGNGSDTTVPADLASVRSISLGTSHACALLSNGKVRCWSTVSAVTGELTVSTVGDPVTGAINVPAALGSAVAVSAGPDSSCAVLTSGRVRCWGAPGAINVPSDLTDVTSVSQAGCAVIKGGTVRCWNGLVVPADLGSVRLLAVGEAHACALLSTDKVRCWGDNTLWQLG